MAVLPIALGVIATFSPGSIRVVLLVAAVIAATWTFHLTEFAGKEFMKTAPAFIVFMLAALIVFGVGHVIDDRAKAAITDSHKTSPAKPEVTPTPVAPPKSSPNAQAESKKEPSPSKQNPVRPTARIDKPIQTTVDSSPAIPIPQSPVIQNNSQGINIGPGAVAPNAQVNNFGPRPSAFAH